MPIQCLTKEEKQDFTQALDLALRSISSEQNVLAQNREQLSNVERFLDLSKDFAGRIAVLQKTVRDAPECLAGVPALVTA